MSIPKTDGVTDAVVYHCPLCGDVLDPDWPDVLCPLCKLDQEEKLADYWAEREQAWHPA